MSAILLLLFFEFALSYYCKDQLAFKNYSVEDISLYNNQQTKASDDLYAEFISEELTNAINNSYPNKMCNVKITYNDNTISSIIIELDKDEYTEKQLNDIYEGIFQITDCHNITFNDQ